jgi:serine/threonine protein phosphatase PrpC
MQKTTVFGKTDMGKLRTNNEDNLVFQHIWDKNHVLGVAIDGVGGYEGGEVAAEIAKIAIVEYLEKYPNGERLVLLAQAVTEANNRIFEERQKQPKLSQMSCVLSAVLVEVSKKRINMAHVGDSRFYQFQNGVLEKLSHDHSYVGYREDVGDLTEEEAMNHPKRNEINRMLGDRKHQPNDADFIEAKIFPLLPNSILLLCSDGLTDLVNRAEISEILSENSSLKKKTQLLIDKANEKGGKDNITVVLIDYQSDEIIDSVDNVVNTNVEILPKTPSKDIPEIAEGKKVKSVVVILIAVLALLLGAGGGWFGKTYLSTKSEQMIPVDCIIDDRQKKDSLQQYIQSLNDTIKVREQKIERLKNVIQELTKPNGP